MKKIVCKSNVLGMLLLCSLNLMAQGVDFRTLSFDEALETSVQEDKLLFIDCYTDWCGPCKMMANTVFTQKEAGDYFNPRFVCIKIDMEKGEGPALREKFDVTAFPTFLLINSDGTLKHRLVGAAPVDKFIELVKQGLTSMRIEDMDALYQEGKLDKPAQMKYWSLLTTSGEGAKAQMVGDTLWSKLSEAEKLTFTYWPLLQSKATALDCAEAQLVLSNRAALEKEIGAKEVNDFMYEMIMSDLRLKVVYQLPDRRYLNIPQIRTLIQQNDVPRKEALLVITDLAEERGNHRYMGYLEVLDKGFPVLNDEERRSVFEGAKLIGQSMQGNEQKAYHKRFSEIAFRAVPSTTYDYVHETLLAMAYTSRRTSADNVYFDDFKYLEGAFEEAAREGKKVAVFLYREGQTTQTIEQQVFTRPQVAQMMNRSFVNYKIDVTTPMGRRLARIYEVPGTHGLLFLEPDGNLCHKISNLLDQNLANRLKDVFDKTKAFGVVEAAYEADPKNPENALNYIHALVSDNTESTKATTVARKLFDQLNDEQRCSKEYWPLFAYWASLQDDEICDYLFNHVTSLRAANGTEVVDKTLESYIYFKLKRNLYLGKADRVPQIQSFLKKESLDNGPMLQGLAQMIDLHAKKEPRVDNYIKASRQMTPGQIPFADLYVDITTWYPERKEEWRKWGLSLCESLDPKMVIWYKKVMDIE